MASRLDLQNLLESILGSENVYYQPPSSVLMKYPAIVYTRDDLLNTHANNGVYTQNTAYRVTIIDKNPDSQYVTAVSKLPMCNYDRHYVLDNLNHDVFTLYF